MKTGFDLSGILIGMDAKKNFLDTDELYTDWYYCPECDNTYVRLNDNFCSNCGCRFQWENTTTKKTELS